MLGMGGKSKPLFDWHSDTGTLYINTNRMSLGWKDNAVIFISDNISNTILLDTDTDINRPELEHQYFGGFCANGEGQWYGIASKATISTIHSHKRRITYDPGVNYEEIEFAGTKLIYDFEVDSNSGEIIISGITYNNPTWQESHPIENTHFTIMNIPDPVIHGCWKTSLSDDNVTYNYVSNLYHETMIISEGVNASFAAWSEDFSSLTKYYLRHVKDTYTHLTFQACREAYQYNDDPSIINHGAIRFTTRTNWLECARRYRERREEIQTDLKPLWENACSWVQDIHCIYSWKPVVAKFSEVAAISPSNTERILYYCLYSNASDMTIVDFDDRYMMTWNNPTAEYISNWTINGYDFKVVAHTLFNLFTKVTNYRVITEPYSSNLPLGYTYPDDVLYDFGNGVTKTVDQMWNQGYWDGCYLEYGGNHYYFDVGIQKVLDFLLYNLRDFYTHNPEYHCRYYDILGEGIVKYNLTITDKSYLDGEIELVKDIYTEYPVIPEYPVPYLTPYCWQSWWGGTTNGPADPSHPLQSAIRGSYQWVKGQRRLTEAQIPHEALLGCLPEFCLDDDWEPSVIAKWTRARATLFCQYELFNDLPDAWVNDGEYTTLAYYRSNTGNMFRFEDRGGGTYAYVEEDSEGDIDRLLYPLPE